MTKSKSLFHLLENEEEEKSTVKSTPVKPQPKPQKPIVEPLQSNPVLKKNAKKKKSKKSKQEGEISLREIAFGGSRNSKQKNVLITFSGDSQPQGGNGEGGYHCSDGDTFERDMQEALLVSQAEFEREKMSRQTTSKQPQVERRKAPRDRAGHKATHQISNGGAESERCDSSSRTISAVTQCPNKSVDGAGVAETADSGLMSASLSPILNTCATAAELNSLAPEGRSFSDEENKISCEELVRQNTALQSAIKSKPHISELATQLQTRNLQLISYMRLVEELRENLRISKSKTKRLLSLLRETESYEKAELVVFKERSDRLLEEALHTRAEMCEQTTAALQQLEQERSRVHYLNKRLSQLTDNKKKSVEITDCLNDYR